MRQRVGFARALAVEPDALLMDEPFSALDVLTAANLRGELIRLWEGREFPVKAILIVTHNIEEAVQLADRILVLSSNPGRIRAELAVAIPRARDRHDPGFEQLVDTVLRHLDRPGRRRRTRRGRRGRGAAGRRPPPPRPTCHCRRSLATPPCCSAWPTCTTPSWRSLRRAATSPTPTSTPAKPCSAS